MKKAPPSIHSKRAEPRRVLSGTYGCVPSVLHSPIKIPNGSRAGFGFSEPFFGLIDSLYQTDYQLEFLLHAYNTIYHSFINSIAVRSLGSISMMAVRTSRNLSTAF